MATYREKFTRWTKLSANLKPLLDEVPSLAEDARTFEALVAKGHALSTRQEELQVELQDAIHERQRIEDEAQQLREYLVVMLRRKLGAHNRRLADLGIKPRRRPGSRRRKDSNQPKPAA